MDKQAEWLAAYVEKCMREIREEEPEGLCCGSDVVWFRSGTAACLVRTEREPLMVRVMAKAVLGVRPTAKLLREINELNARSLVANCWWGEGDVIVECSLFADAVNPTSLSQASSHVGRVANDIGIGFAAMFDGSTPYPPFASDSEDAA